MENQLPKNWVETELKNITSYVIGGDWGKDITLIDDDFVEVLCIRGSEIKNWNQNKGNSASLRKIKKSSLENRKLKLGDILLEISGGGPDQPVGRTVYIDKTSLNFKPKIEKVCTNFLRLLRVHDNLNSEFINHYLQYFYTSGEITKYQGGSNNLRNLKFKEYETIIIPLPPLAEQNRIVSKLDALFKQLETIKTSMTAIPVLLKNFRQQVLTQAVTGKLTEEWRKGKELEEWLNINLSELIIEKPRNGYSPQAVGYETPVKSLSLSAITSGSFDSSYVKYLDIEAPSENSHLWLKNGDILIQRSNSLEYVGTSAIYDSQDFEFIYPDIMIKIRANDKITTNYLNYSLSSFKTREYFRNNATGTAGNMPKINQAVVMNTPINLPSDLEQAEIEVRVESLFAKTNDIEKKYKSLKEKIDSLPQALLHKAFKGELTEQLDSDGDAKELLKQIQELKNSAVKPKKATTKKVKNYPENEGVLGMVAETKEEYPCK